MFCRTLLDSVSVLGRKLCVKKWSQVNYVIHRAVGPSRCGCPSYGRLHRAAPAILLVVPAKLGQDDDPNSSSLNPMGYVLSPGSIFSPKGSFFKTSGWASHAGALHFYGSTCLEASLLLIPQVEQLVILPGENHFVIQVNPDRIAETGFVGPDQPLS